MDPYLNGRITKPGGTIERLHLERGVGICFDIYSIDSFIGNLFAPIVTYIFTPESFTVERLWEIVKDYQTLCNTGAVGDCLLRQEASKEAEGTYTVLNMEFIASRAMYELLIRKRLHPDQFTK